MAPSEIDFLPQNGGLSTMIRSFDWDSTPLGPPSAWPEAVRVITETILHSARPMVALWGEEGVMIYNDAYSEIAGARHPELLGCKVREGWPEAADFNDHVLRTVLAGETLAFRDQHLALHRGGRATDAWFELDYSPVPGSDGRPIGVLATVIETTERVVAERWRSSEVDRLRGMFEQAPGFVAMMRGEDHVFELVNEAYRRLVGHRDVVGQTAREAYPDLEGQGFFEMLDNVFATGTPYVGTALPIKFESEPGRPEDKFIDLIYQAIRDPEGRVVGVFAQGHDVSDRVRAEQALAAVERQSRQILDGATDYAIIALDLMGRIVRWNEGARRIFGWGAAEVAGQPWAMLFVPEDKAADKPREAMHAALEHGTTHHNRWHLRNSGERFWASGSISPLLDEQGQPTGFVKVLRDRTDEHLSVHALAEAEARLRRAQDAGGVGVFSLDLDTHLLSPSPEFCRIFGLEPCDAIPVDDIQALMFEEDLEASSNPNARRAGTAPLDVEYRIHRATDGEVRVIARKGEYERNAAGRPIRLVGAVQDVTERREALRELHESEARFRALVQAIPDHIWSARTDGSVDWFNDRTYHYTGEPEGSLSGGGWARIVHPDDLEATKATWRKARDSGQAYEMEYRLRDRNGRYRWHIARGIPVRDDAGTIIRWIGTNTDIHDQRETRDKLEAINHTLEESVAERTADRDRMWRLSTDIMLVADFDAKIMSVNPAWKTLLDWDESDLLGRPFMDLIHPEDIEATLAEVGKLAEGATTFRFENRYQAKDGSYRRVSWTAVPDDAFIHAVGRDVTAEQEAAETLRKTEIALQQAQKMEAIGNLTGGVAHDFNNLLQVVSGNLQLLGKDVVGNDKAQRRIANALAGVERGSKLASQLLAFGRRQALDPRVVNVGRLIRGMDEMLRRTIGEGVEVETIVSGGLWNTLIDPMQIENALLNLAINGRDAMEGFGKLTIEAGNSYLDDAYARSHQDVEPGQYVVLSVTDTGTGMSSDLIEKVFEPFFSTKPEGKGTGLGLSMVYGFVKQSGGHVKIYSELGLGTTVKMYLPRSMQQEDMEASAVDTPVEGGPETILVAEDDEGVRSTVVEMLQELGYRVLKASDAMAALTVIESGIPIDLLFTDVVMPGPMKSAEMAKKAKERLPRLAVLFTSGYTENSIVHGGRLDPGVQLLSKPYTREALARKIRYVLDLEKQPTRQEDPADAAVSTDRPLSVAAGETKRRVLLVEDNLLIRIATADMLVDLGYEVVEGGSAEEALVLLEKEQVEVLVTDLGLPGMSGEDFCVEVRSRWPQIGIVFATGASHGPILPDTSRTVLLSKPHGLEELKKAIECVLV